MPAREENRVWLGKDADTPAGKAWDAVRRADYSELRTTLERYGSEATKKAQGPIGHPVTALTAAARQGDTRAMTMLLEAGADPCVKASGNITASPMAWSIEADSAGCVRLLIDTLPRTADGQDVRQPDDEDWCDLAILWHDYIAHPGPDILQQLLEAGARATQEALCRAITQGIHQAVQLLLDHGADPNAVDERTGGTPLGWCVGTLGGTAGDMDTTGPRMLELLLARNADPNTGCGRPGAYRPSVLVAALDAGSAWAIKQLVAAGADIEEARKHMRTHGPLMHRGNAAQVVETLRLIL